MKQPHLAQRLRTGLDDFIKNLKEIYGEGLISVILYGSAASGEFVYRHSNLNLLVVLKNADLENLKKASGVINKWKFRDIHPLFFTKEYIMSSNDVFPIEFLDMKENYTVLTGEDILKDAVVNTKNLRFQCEQELKVKLINLRQLYLRRNKYGPGLSNLLFKSFTSILHILRNVLRLKGKQPPYLKEEILKEINAEFRVDEGVWKKILAAKNKQIKLSAREIERLFIDFVKDLEKIIDVVDKL
jgi:predicted nucleotidyltransferase